MEKLTAKDFKDFIESASNNLSNNHHRIDTLNVFPVPDGDTGTNMHLTFTSGKEQLNNAKSDNFGESAKIFSRGLLMGARGNSGVILSQVFRGFAKSVKDKAEVTASDLAEAFVKGSEVAYKAIMRPVEGTILTVVREASAKAKEKTDHNPDLKIEDYFEELVLSAEETLKRTPDLLPVLKEVGVLDSGGSGFVEVIKGFLAASKGEIIKLATQEEVSENKKEVGYRTQLHVNVDQMAKDDQSIIDKLNLKLSQLGENVIVYDKDNKLMISLNTLVPGQVLNSVQRYGIFDKIQIENLNEELQASIVEPMVEEPSEYAIIAVANGDGIVSMFKDLGANYIVTGGQTMNPSTESFVQIIDKIKAEHIIILPNNSNIIMAAQQTIHVLKDRDITVLETKSIPQGLSATIAFDPEVDLETNIEAMKDAYEHAVSGSITYSIKDTTIDGVEIKAKDYMGIMDGKIVVSNSDIYKSTKALIDHIIKEHDDEYSVLTIIGGEDIDNSDLELIKHYVNKNYPDYEVETTLGKQPVYSYYIGLD